MQLYRNAVGDARQAFRRLQAAEDEWLTGFDIARELLTRELDMYDMANERMADETLRLMDLCMDEACSEKRRKRTMTFKDCFTELITRDLMLYSSLDAHKMKAQSPDSAADARTADAHDDDDNDDKMTITPEAAAAASPRASRSSNSSSSGSMTSFASIPTATMMLSEDGQSVVSGSYSYMGMQPCETTSECSRRRDEDWTHARNLEKVYAAVEEAAMNLEAPLCAMDSVFSREYISDHGDAANESGAQRSAFAIADTEKKVIVQFGEPYDGKRLERDVDALLKINSASGEGWARYLLKSTDHKSSEYMGLRNRSANPLTYDMHKCLVAVRPRARRDVPLLLSRANALEDFFAGEIHVAAPHAHDAASAASVSSCVHSGAQHHARESLPLSM